MLEQCVQELQQVYHYISIASSTSGSDCSDTDVIVDGSNHIGLLSQIISSLDPKDLHLVRHSFGGTTKLLAAQQ